MVQKDPPASPAASLPPRAKPLTPSEIKRAWNQGLILAATDLRARQKAEQQTLPRMLIDPPSPFAPKEELQDFLDWALKYPKPHPLELDAAIMEVRESLSRREVPHVEAESVSDSPENAGLPLLSFFPWLTLRRLERSFWMLFIALPIFTGWLSYDLLPNEAFDKQHHIAISSHIVCHGAEDQECGDAVDIWKDARTGKTYTRAQFAHHEQTEHFRMLYTNFGYGLIGCLAFGVFRETKNRGIFFSAFGKAVLVNAGICLIFYLYGSL
jgi:hypothetical protein